MIGYIPDDGIYIGGAVTLKNGDKARIIDLYIKGNVQMAEIRLEESGDIIYLPSDEVQAGWRPSFLDSL
jgi:hypothetical protein